jgi:hypothetical protein
VVTQNPAVGTDILVRCKLLPGVGGAMGRFSRAIRGFFGSLFTGVEQRNPEILLETAVQDELNNLKKLQVAAARTMAYEKMLANDAASKQKVVTVKERQARELAARGQREAAIEVVQQKQEVQTSLWPRSRPGSRRPGRTPRRWSEPSATRSVATTNTENREPTRSVQADCIPTDFVRRS